MQSKLWAFYSLIVVVCLSLLMGCSLLTTTGSSPASIAQNPTASAQNAPVPSSSVSPTGTAVVQNVVVTLPSFADLLDVAEHSVVKIDTQGTGTTVFGRTVQQQGAGSGWIMDANGTIVTNNH